MNEDKGGASPLPVRFDSLMEFTEAYKEIVKDGLFLPLDPPPPVRSEIPVTLFIPGAEEEIIFDGRVFFSSKERTGIFLMDLMGEKKEKLDRYLRLIERAIQEASAKRGEEEKGKRIIQAVGPGREVKEGVKISSIRPETVRPGPVGAGAAPSPPPEPSHPVDEPEGADIIIRGNLAERPFGDILLWLYQRKEEGVLEIMEEGRRRKIYYVRGSPVSVETQPIIHGECLGVLLFRTGKITEEDLKESLSVMAESGQKQGEVLINMGLLSYSDLIISLQMQTEVIITRLLNLKSGRFLFRRSKGIEKRTINPPVDVPALLFRILRKRFKEFTKKEMEKFDSRYQTRYLSRNSASPISPYEVKFTRAERKFWDTLVDGTKLMRDIYRMTTMSPVDTFAFIHAMHSLGILEFSERIDTGREMEILKERLMKKFLFIKEKNLFEILEIHWTANTEKVEAAYKKLMDDYSPERLMPGRDLPEDVKEIRGFITGRMEEAYQLLKDDIQRKEYRKSLMDVEKIKFSAELLRKQGNMANVRRDIETALDCFEKAFEITGDSRDKAEIAKLKEVKG